MPENKLIKSVLANEDAVNTAIKNLRKLRKLLAEIETKEKLNGKSKPTTLEILPK